MKKASDVLGLFLPRFFSAVLSCRKNTDKRIIKYFLPYGLMRKRMQEVFFERVGDPSKDKGLVGVFRAMCPYGIVLWWDSADVRSGRAVVVKAPSPVAAPRPVQSQINGDIQRRIDGLRRTCENRMDRLELLILRMCSDRTGGAAESGQDSQ